jgi:hypothetical protein
VATPGLHRNKCACGNGGLPRFTAACLGKRRCLFKCIGSRELSLPRRAVTGFSLRRLGSHMCPCLTRAPRPILGHGRFDPFLSFEVGPSSPTTGARPCVRSTWALIATSVPNSPLAPRAMMRMHSPHRTPLHGTVALPWWRPLPPTRVLRMETSGLRCS